MEKNSLTKPTSWRQRVPLLLILAAFILPALAAFFLLRFNGWQQLAHTENGLLITTPTQLEPLFINNKSVGNQSILNKRPAWKLIYIADSTCATPCQLALMQLRQIHKALGVEQARVEQWLLPMATPDSDFQSLIHTAFADMKITDMVTAEQIAWFAQTPAYAQQSDIHQWVWIVDPLGQVVTAYPTQTDMQAAILAGKWLLKDLQRLLKLSRVG